MGFPLLRYNVQLPMHGVWKEGFTEEEVEKIVFLEKLMDFTKGRVGAQSKQQLDTTTRDSDVSFLTPDENAHWIFQRLADITPRVNYDLFLYDIETIETIQFTRYTEDQFYDWHIDSHNVWLNYERKISGVVFLDDPDDYEGGELEIITDGSPDRSIKIKPNKGEIAYFASWMPHRALPVTKGTRRTLVFWVQGKRTI
jgi:PKHD-type hydroxylase